MYHYILTRLLSGVVVIFGVSLLVFLMVRLVPGDPVEVMVGEFAQVADKDAIRERLGLDKPVLEQLVVYYQKLFQFDLGQSIHTQKNITDILLEKLPATAYLACVALLLAIVIAIPLGVIAAVHKGDAIDNGAMAFSLLGVSIPNFWLGPLLILLFSLHLNWLPVSGDEHAGAIILPAITLGTAMAAILSRMVRSTVLEVLTEDYIRTARAKGLKERVVVYKHALRNAMLPVITILGLQLGTLLGGAVITETVFSWPGIGSEMVDGIQNRDYPIVQACVLVISLLYVVVNVMTDIIYAWVDPRIRLAEGQS
ncbi:MAG: ABC transporter permease [Methylococcales bacterium]|jgi:peptide/nickel transport system permease protein|nr:ABC transporter permease [Methylococcales bacterium]MBT7444772.1 ABC transporter permease [Methylococcales bacterium]